MQVEHGDWRCYNHNRCPRPECRAAWAQYVKVAKFRRDNGGSQYQDAAGTRRRLQALARLGYSQSRLSELTGLDPETIRKLCRGRRITLKTTAEVVKRVYDQYSMVLPPYSGAVAQVRDRAAAKGYAPPLAWDEDRIDDPAAQPRGLPATERGKRCGKGLHLLAEVGTYDRPDGKHECLACRKKRNDERRRTAA